MADGQGQQGGGQGKGGGGSRQQGKEGQQVNELAGKPVRVSAQKGPAGLRVLLLISPAYMEHKSESHRQGHVKTPGNGAPVKQGIDRRPVLHAAQVGDVGF